MFFSRKEKGDHNLCVVDIGSGTVAGAFIDIIEGDKPSINFTFRSKIKEATPGVPYARYFFSMISSLEEVMTELAHNSKKMPKNVTVYLRSPWLASTARVIKMENVNGFDFTKEALEKLVVEDNKTFIKELADGGEEHKGYEIIDQRTCTRKLE